MQLSPNFIFISCHKENQIWRDNLKTGIRLHHRVFLPSVVIEGVGVGRNISRIPANSDDKSLYSVIFSALTKERCVACQAAREEFPQTDKTNKKLMLIYFSWSNISSLIWSIYVENI